MFELQLEQTLLSHGNAIPLSEPLQPPEVNTILHDILLRHPEMFWFQGKWHLQQAKQQIWFVPVYSFSKMQAERTQMRISQVVSQLTSTEKSNLECAKAIFLNLCGWTAYDAGTCGGQTVYDALIDRKAYCKGLAKAYQLILSHSGVPCRLAEGLLYGQYRHVWNEIYIDSCWYAADPSTAYPQVRETLGLKETVFAVPEDTLPSVYQKEASKWK